jgi:hypothetical protein
MAPIDTAAGAGAIVRYHVSFRQGAVGLGVLLADLSRWLSYEPLSGSPGEHEGTCVSAVEPGSHLVIDAPAAGAIDASVSKLDWTIVCARQPANIFGLLLNTTRIPAGACG